MTAGWLPGRRVFVDLRGLSELKSYDSASALLSEFGGLQVGHCGPGRDQATSDICFLSRTSVDDRCNVADRAEFADEDLFPLAEAHNGHMELYLGASGRLFAYGVPDDSLHIVAESFASGIEKLLLGHRFDG